MSFAIFIQPERKFLSLLRSWKKRINKELPNQKYTLHPPHMTILNMDVKNESNAIKITTNAARSLNPIQITIDKPKIFFNDPSTGGHTLFFSIKNNSFINTLQVSLAEDLMGEKNIKSPPNFITKSDNFLRSYNKYGSPFIGKHWVPHFSISSIIVEKTNPIIREFLSINFNHHFTVHQLSIWRIINDTHTKLTNVPLK
mgnify:CR=1 FL=1